MVVSSTNLESLSQSALNGIERGPQIDDLIDGTLKDDRNLYKRTKQVKTDDCK